MQFFNQTCRIWTVWIVSQFSCLSLLAKGYQFSLPSTLHFTFIISTQQQGNRGLTAWTSLDVVQSMWKGPDEAGAPSRPTPSPRPRVHLEFTGKKHGPAAWLNSVFQAFISWNEKHNRSPRVESIYFYKKAFLFVSCCSYLIR